MGLLSQLSYLDYGSTPLKKDDSFNNFTYDGINYTIDSSYTVIDYTSTDTDMQAILLEKNDTSGNPTGEYVIAFRGTEGWFDVGTDLKIGLENYNPQFDDAKAFVQEMMSTSTYNLTAKNLTLTGHSLGGILTQSVGAVLGIKGYAFNPYGTERLLTMWPSVSGTFAEALLNEGLYQVLNAFGLESSYADFARKNIMNVSFNDCGTLNGDILSNFASALTSDHLGTYLPIFGDNVGLDGHNISVLNAAFQHYNEILAHFPETTTMNDLSLVYSLSGEDGYNRVEKVFSELNISGTQEHSLTLDVFAIDDSDGNITLLSTSDLESRANTNIAYRYALANLNPFAVIGANYDSFNQDGKLDLVGSQGQLSEKWLTNREEVIESNNKSISEFLHCFQV
jgi:hypothetical protein